VYSSAFSPFPAFFSIGQWPSMDYKHCTIVIKNVHDLKPKTTLSPAAYKPFVVVSFLRIQNPGTVDNTFRFLWGYAMCCEVVYVPLVPSEFKDHPK
jgi:hypothetical protein